MSTENNKQVVISTDTAQAFIIPNSLNRVSEIYNPSQRLMHLDRMAELSGMEQFDSSTILVDIWYTDKETLGTDNLIDHGCKVTISGKEYRCYPSSTFSMMPIEIFQGKKEGDTVEISLPVHFVSADRNKDQEREELDGVLKMKVTLNQKSFRYSIYGTFEEVLAKLRASFTR